MNNVVSCNTRQQVRDTIAYHTQAIRLSVEVLTFLRELAELPGFSCGRMVPIMPLLRGMVRALISRACTNFDLLHTPAAIAAMANVVHGTIVAASMLNDDAYVEQLFVDRLSQTLAKISMQLPSESTLASNPTHALLYGEFDAKQHCADACRDLDGLDIVLSLLRELLLENCSMGEETVNDLAALFDHLTRMVDRPVYSLRDELLGAAIEVLAAQPRLRKQNNDGGKYMLYGAPSHHYREKVNV